jgi:tetratricopeptide (TPR) repeat protein
VRRGLLILVLGSLTGAAVALVCAEFPAVLPAAVRGHLSAPVRSAASWSWKGLAALAPLIAAVSLLRPGSNSARSRGAAAATGTGVSEAKAPAPAARPVADLGPSRRRIIPVPPTPFFAQPLAAGARFMWRARERQDLSEWYKSRTTPVYVLLGEAGVGKSALARIWVHKDVLGLDAPQIGHDPPDVADACRLSSRVRPQGVLWWSFEDPTTAFPAFLDAALAYVSRGAVNPRECLSSPLQKLESLLELLEKERHLLILDGFECELLASASPEVGDRVEDGAAGSNLRRACASPQAAELLRRLRQRQMRSRVLLTTRLLPRELSDPETGEVLAGVDHHLLVGLELADAVAILQCDGVTGSTERLEEICRAWRGHPLALRALGGLLRGTRSSARLRGLRRLLPPRGDPDPHRRIVDRAVRAAGRGARRVLGVAAAVRAAATPATIAAIEAAPDAAGIEAAAAELAARGLAAIEPDTAALHVHPLVRSVAYARLTDRARVHARLAELRAAEPSAVQVACFEDLGPSLERYGDLIGAGRYEEAYALLTQRLSAHLTQRFAEHHLHALLLAALFVRGERKPPRLASSADRAWVIDSLAAAWSYSGQTRRAAAVCEAGLGAFGARTAEHATILSRLAGLEARLGLLRSADEHLRRLVELQAHLGDEVAEATARCRRGLLMSCCGEAAESMAQLDLAFGIIDRSAAHRLQAIVFAYCARRALLMGDAPAALQAARRARASAEKTARSAEPDEHDFVRSGLLVGEALLAGVEAGGPEEGRLVEAERYIADSMSRCRRANLVGFEADLLLAWARWHRLRGDRPRAAQSAADALAIAERCEYRLEQADVHAFLARLEADGGDRIAACRHAELAIKRAWCDGPPYSYRPVAEEAERLLADLGGALRPSSAVAA